ncbi:MAG TPA: DoxX family protein [Thermoanaerobaculia bacterium]|nr:DoxX family protein [Thermoanaerobaculia bacterium]
MPRVTNDAAALTLRVAAGLIFLPHGWSKISGDGGAGAFAADVAANYGIPALFGYIAAYAEVGGALFLIAGLFTRLNAFLLGATMFVATFIVQLPDALYGVPADAIKTFVALRAIETPLALLAMCVALLLSGAGRMSLDHLLHVDERAARLLPQKRRAATEAAALEM